MNKPNRIQINDDYTLVHLKLDYSEYDSLLQKIEDSSYSTKEIKDITNFNRKFEWLSIRELLLEDGLTEHDVKYDVNGKPHLSPNNLHLSISHSKHRIAIGLNKNHSIGIDIQKVSSGIEKIKHKYLNPEEVGRLSDNSPLCLTKAWSVKEAIFKVNGKKDIFLKENIEILEMKKKEDYIYMYTKLHNANFKKHYKVHVIEIEDYVLAYTMND